MGASALHTPAYKKLCRLLRGWREEAAFTQRGLAAVLKKPHSYVYKVEAAERRIDPVEFVAWCRACDIDPRDAIAQVGR